MRVWESIVGGGTLLGNMSAHSGGGGGGGGGGGRGGRSLGRGNMLLIVIQSN